jgi:hypothetical protein
MSTNADSTPVLSSDQVLDDARSFFEFDAGGPTGVAVAPGGSFPPPAPPTTATPILLAPPAPPVLSAQAAALPTLAPAVPQPAQQRAENSFALPLNSKFDAGKSPRPPKQRLKKGRLKRFFGFLLLLALIGGAVWGGITYGPELMSLANGESEPTEETGPTAPLKFPIATVPAPVVRTATFTVQNPPNSDMPLSYEVTTDFETGISQIVIDRTDQPQLEILTIFDGAVIRRTDESVWYQLERGEFPIDRDLGRERWVRSLGELFPRSVRDFATIDDASEEVLGDELTRRLVVSIDPIRLLTEVPIDPAPVDVAEPVVEPVAEPVAEPVIEPSVPPGLTLEATAVPDQLVTIELWIDKSGTIRRLILPPALGGETVTVISTSPEAWQPQFPGQDQLEPLTASALFGLGL